MFYISSKSDRSHTDKLSLGGSLANLVPYCCKFLSFIIPLILFCLLTLPYKVSLINIPNCGKKR